MTSLVTAPAKFEFDENSLTRGTLSQLRNEPISGSTFFGLLLGSEIDRYKYFLIMKIQRQVQEISREIVMVKFKYGSLKNVSLL